jgi:hypothetical protein
MTSYVAEHPLASAQLHIRSGFFFAQGHLTTLLMATLCLLQAIFAEHPA